MTKKPVMRSISFTEKNKKTKWKFLQSGSTFPGSGSADSDQHQNELTPQHCLQAFC